MPIPAGLASWRRACVRSIANVSGLIRAGTAVAAARSSIVWMPARAQSLALHGSHPGHEQQVAACDHLGVAGGAATARDDAELAAPVAPGDGGALRAERQLAVVDEGTQPRAAELEHREDVGDLVHAHRAVAEQQLHPIGARHPEPVELIDVGRELHERGDLGAPRELGVLHDPAAGLMWTCPEPVEGSRTRKSAKPTKSGVENAAW